MPWSRARRTILLLPLALGACASDRAAPPGDRVAPPGDRVAPPGDRVAPPGDCPVAEVLLPAPVARRNLTPPPPAELTADGRIAMLFAEIGAKALAGYSH